MFRPRHAALLAAFLLTACFAKSPKVPEGVTVVKPPEPPLPSGAIVDAQRRLKELDLYVGPTDGELTPATRVAIARFQRSRQLKATGTLDDATAAALGLQPLATYPAAPTGPGTRAAETETPRPSSEEILAAQRVQPLPQPPPGALDPALQEAARLLGGGIDTAQTDLKRSEGKLPDTQRAAEADAAAAQRTLFEARSKAFDTLLAARRQGGWAPLPVPLLSALEQALQDRALLLRGQDGALGPDDQAAIRWLQRSMGLEPTGEPSLELLENLGIDPGPMFGEEPGPTPPASGLSGS